MNIIYHLSSCSTNKRILAELPLEQFKLIDIKDHPLSDEELEGFYKHTSSYEALINKRAQLFKAEGIAPNGQSEDRYRELLKSHYTYLKRPVIQYQDKLYIGNAKSTIESLTSHLESTY